MADFGTTRNLVGGILTLTLPASKYWFIQNQDVQPLLITFPSGSGISAVALGAASVLGGAGDWLDSERFPWMGPSVVLTSGVATALFGSGCSLNRPGEP